MPKYYVKSGQIKFIIDSPDHISAILAALKHYKGRGVMTGLKVCISENGFDDFHQWTCYDTDEYIRKT
jgi:hypothetical protein